MGTTDVQMARAVAVMGISGYCGLPRQRGKKKAPNICLRLYLFSEREVK